MSTYRPPPTLRSLLDDQSKAFKGLSAAPRSPREYLVQHGYGQPITSPLPPRPPIGGVAGSPRHLAPVVGGASPSHTNSPRRPLGGSVTPGSRTSSGDASTTTPKQSFSVVGSNTNPITSSTYPAGQYQQQRPLPSVNHQQHALTARKASIAQSASEAALLAGRASTARKGTVLSSGEGGIAIAGHMAPIVSRLSHPVITDSKVSRVNNDLFGVGEIAPRDTSASSAPMGISDDSARTGLSSSATPRRGAAGTSSASAIVNAVLVNGNEKVLLPEATRFVPQPPPPHPTLSTPPPHQSLVPPNVQDGQTPGGPRTPLPDLRSPFGMLAAEGGRDSVFSNTTPLLTVQQFNGSSASSDRRPHAPGPPASATPQSTDALVGDSPQGSSNGTTQPPSMNHQLEDDVMAQATNYQPAFSVTIHQATGETNNNSIQSNRMGPSASTSTRHSHGPATMLRFDDLPPPSMFTVYDTASSVNESTANASASGVGRRSHPTAVSADLPLPISGRAVQSVRTAPAVGVVGMSRTTDTALSTHLQNAIICLKAYQELRISVSESEHGKLLELAALVGMAVPTATAPSGAADGPPRKTLASEFSVSGRPNDDHRLSQSVAVASPPAPTAAAAATAPSMVPSSSSLPADGAIADTRRSAENRDVPLAYLQDLDCVGRSASRPEVPTLGAAVRIMEKFVRDNLLSDCCMLHLWRYQSKSLIAIDAHQWGAVVPVKRADRIRGYTSNGATNAAIDPLVASTSFAVGGLAMDASMAAGSMTSPPSLLGAVSFAPLAGTFEDIRQTFLSGRVMCNGNHLLVPLPENCVDNCGEFRHWGVLEVVPAKGKSFAEAHREILPRLLTLGNQLRAIVNHYDQLSKNSKTAEAMHTVVSIAHSLAHNDVLDDTRLTHTILESARSVCDAERAFLFTLSGSDANGNWTELVARSRNGKEYRVPRGKGVAGRVAETGVRMNIADAERDGLFLLPADADIPVKSVLCVPVKFEGTLVGVAQLINKVDPSYVPLNGTTSTSRSRTNSPTSMPSIHTPLESRHGVESSNSGSSGRVGSAASPIGRGPGGGQGAGLHVPTFSKDDEECFENLMTLLGLCLRTCTTENELMRERAKMEGLFGTVLTLGEADLADMKSTKERVLAAGMELASVFDGFYLLMVNKEHNKLELDPQMVHIGGSYGLLPGGDDGAAMNSAASSSNPASVDSLTIGSAGTAVGCQGGNTKCRFLSMEGIAGHCVSTGTLQFVKGFCGAAPRSSTSPQANTHLVTVPPTTAGALAACNIAPASSFFAGSTSGEAIQSQITSATSAAVTSAPASLFNASVDAISIKADQLESIMCVPITVGGDVIAVLQLVATRPDALPKRSSSFGNSPRHSPKSPPTTGTAPLAAKGGFSNTAATSFSANHGSHPLSLGERLGLANSANPSTANSSTSSHGILGAAPSSVSTSNFAMSVKGFVNDVISMSNTADIVASKRISDKARSNPSPEFIALMKGFALFAGIWLRNADLMAFTIRASKAATRLTGFTPGVKNANKQQHSSEGIGGGMSGSEMVGPRVEPAEVSAIRALVLPEAVAETMESPSFNIWSLRHQSTFSPMAAAARVVLDLIMKTGLPKQFGCKEETLANFIVACRTKYRSVPYHSFYHAVDVLQTMYTFLYTGGAAKKMGRLEQFVMLIVALVHDLDHMGLNNSYYMKTESPLGILNAAGGSTSVLEVHHCNLAIDILSYPEYNIFEGLQKEELQVAYRLMIEAILQTDMAKHGDTVAQLKSFDANGFDLQSDEHRRFAAITLMKAADISNVTKPFPISKEWGQAVVEEFSQQGDKEKSQGITDVLPMFDREKNADLAKSQIGFMDYVVIPFYSLVVQKLFPEMEFALEQLRVNRDTWSNGPQ